MTIKTVLWLLTFFGVLLWSVINPKNLTTKRFLKVEAG